MGEDISEGGIQFERNLGKDSIQFERNLGEGSTRFEDAALQVTESDEKAAAAPAALKATESFEKTAAAPAALKATESFEKAAAAPAALKDRSWPAGDRDPSPPRGSFAKLGNHTADTNANAVSDDSTLADSLAKVRNHTDDANGVSDTSTLSFLVSLRELVDQAIAIV